MRCSGSALRGQHADRDVGDRLEVAGELEPAFAGHHHVEDDDVEGQTAHGGARAGGVGGRRDAKARSRTGSAPAGRGCADRRRRPGYARRCREAYPWPSAGAVGFSFSRGLPRSAPARAAAPRPARAPPWLIMLNRKRGARHRCRPAWAQRLRHAPRLQAVEAAARAAPFSVRSSSRWRRSRSPAFCAIQPSSTSCLSTRARLCLVIFRISSRSATRRPGWRLTKCSTR